PVTAVQRLGCRSPPGASVRRPGERAPFHDRDRRRRTRSTPVDTCCGATRRPYSIAACDSMDRTGSEPVRAHDPLQELLRPGLARRAEHLLGRSLLEDDAVV